MQLEAQLNQDLIQAMKDKDELTLSTLRLLKSVLKNASIEKGQELNDQEIITIIHKEVKKRQEAAVQYNQAGREDIATKEEKEAEILQKYLPAQMTQDELKIIVNQAIQATNAAGPQDLGKVMSKVMPQVQGKADGSQVSSLVREALGHE